jgi:hypothetical protein
MAGLSAYDTGGIVDYVRRKSCRACSQEQKVLIGKKTKKAAAIGNWKLAQKQLEERISLGKR